MKSVIVRLVPLKRGLPCEKKEYGRVEVDLAQSGLDVLHDLSRHPDLQQYLGHLPSYGQEVRFLCNLHNGKDGAHCSHGARNLLESPFVFEGFKSTISSYPDGYRRVVDYENWVLEVVYPVESDIFVGPPARLRTEKPLLWLDFDGVINASHYDFSDVQEVKIISHGSVAFSVKYSPAVVSCINKWAEHAEIQWLTTWEHHARFRAARAIGLKDFAVSRVNKWSHLCCYEVSVPPEVLTEMSGRPLIWIDDDLPDKHYKYATLGKAHEAAQSWPHSKLLCISPR